MGIPGMAQEASGSDIGYALGQLKNTRSAALVPASYVERLDMQIAATEQLLADFKRAHEILTKNPELQELLSILQRSHF